MDRDNDRKHPKKCNRPIARGVYSGRFLVITGIILLTAALSFVLCFRWRAAVGMDLHIYIIEYRLLS